MAIPTGGGVEGLRSVMFNALTDDNMTLITGVRYHIYTVISIIIHNSKGSAASNSPYLGIVGYDVHGSASAQTIHLYHIPVLGTGETFVVNDKFSFYGCENDVTQGTTTPQYLKFTGGNSSDNYDITVTYIDQDWT